MKSKQLAIPGLPLPQRKAKRTNRQMIAELADRILRLEMELSLLKIKLRKHPGVKEVEDCYFYSDDRCLGKPPDACPWSVKVGQWEWLCAYPWTEKREHD